MNIYMSVFATLAIASSCIYAVLWDPYPLMYSDIRTFLCYENFKKTGMLTGIETGSDCISVDGLSQNQLSASATLCGALLVHAAVWREENKRTVRI